MMGLFEEIENDFELLKALRSYHTILEKSSIVNLSLKKTGFFVIEGKLLFGPLHKTWLKNEITRIFILVTA